jgi:uncharacterized protein (DUF58 family)
MQLSPQALHLLDSFALRAKRSFYGMRQGAHRSQRRGHGVEFAEYRQYEVGDNPRAIDWNLYSRSDKLYCKRYLEEENVAVYILIDGSRSLTHTAIRSKWDTAVAIASCIGYVALATQDPVMISVLGGPHSPRYWGGRAFAPLSRFLSAATDTIVSEQTVDIDLVRMAKQAAARVRFPGICVFISDLLYPREILQQVLAPLRARNMEIHVVQVLGPKDLSLIGSQGGAVLIDSETGGVRGVEVTKATEAQYAKVLREHNTAVRSDCLSAQVSYTQALLTGESSSIESVEQAAIEECALATIRRMGLFI